MTDRNPFAALARAEKTAKLVRRIDKELRREEWTVSELVAFLRSDKADDDWWLECARSAGLVGKSGKVLVPSALTIACVLAEFEARTADEASEEPTDRELGEIASW